MYIKIDPNNDAWSIATSIIYEIKEYNHNRNYEEPEIKTEKASKVLRCLKHYLEVETEDA